ncbi:MAG: YCF48-related protein [Bacteroidota bacterium]|nr:hypothetical protein [Odoribacter sp.]MDP3642879.1 YCF48-related protein [Bacteroidota bacterium]
MKKITIILVVLIAMIIKADAQWSRLTSGTINDLYSVYFTSTNTGYAVGGSSNGQIILKTINGGTSWAPQTSNIHTLYQVYFTLFSVYFPDAITGYAVGGDGSPSQMILKTTNGGTTWTEQIGATTNQLNSVYFTDANTGYAVGRGGTILKTINGGTNWTVQSSGSSIELYSVYFTDANTGYAIGGGGGGQIILKTTNGGTNWTTQTAVTKPVDLALYSIYFTDANTGYIVGEAGMSGTILKTINGGTNWIAQPTGTIPNHLYSVYFTDANTGYAVGGGGTILKTINGGTNWTALAGGTLDKFRSVYFTNANEGYVVGQFGVILKAKEVTAIEENIVNTHLNIYPNPASDFVNLNISNTNNAELTLNIYNVMGVLISSETLQQNQQQINIGDLHNGIYMVVIKSKEWSEKQELIIQR